VERERAYARSRLALLDEAAQGLARPGSVASRETEWSGASRRAAGRRL